jgi:hypothetical protein
MAIKDLIFLKQRHEDYMELVFDTNLMSDPTVTLQIGGVGPGGVTVDWGDGTVESFTTATPRDRDYATDGIYTVRIYGNLTRYGVDTGLANQAKLIAVTKFNEATKNFENAFRLATNLTEVPSVLPVGVTNMNGMFNSASVFNQDIGGWVTGLASQPSGFSDQANATFANNANLLKPFLSDGVTRITS